MHNSKISIKQLPWLVLFTFLTVMGNASQIINFNLTATAGLRVRFLNLSGWFQPVAMLVLAVIVGINSEFFLSQYRKNTYYLSVIAFFIFYAVFSLILNISIVVGPATKAKLINLFGCFYQIDNPLFAIFWLLLLAPVLLYFLNTRHQVHLKRALVSFGVLFSLIQLVLTFRQPQYLNYLNLIALLFTLAVSYYLTKYQVKLTKYQFILSICYEVLIVIGLLAAYCLAPLSWTGLFTIPKVTSAWLIIAIILLVLLSRKSILSAVTSHFSLLFSTVLAALTFGNQAGGISHDWWMQGVKYSDILTGSRGYFIGHLIWKLASVTLLIVVIETIRYLAAQDWSKLRWRSHWVQMAVSILIVPASFFILQASNFQFQLWSIAAYQDTTPVLLVLALNIILLEVFYWALLALINRYWIGNGIYGIFIIILAFANDQKMLNRFEPILPMDLQNIVILPELVKMVGTHLVIILIAVLIVIMIGLFWIQHKSKLGKIFTWKSRLSIILAGIATFTFWIFFLPSLNPKWEAGKSADISSNKLMAKINYAPDYIIDFQKHFRKNGEVLGFLSLVRVTTMDKPANYSEAKMTQLATKYQKLAKQINKQRAKTLSKQTVIYVLSESLANPERIPGVKLKQDPMPYINSLKKQDGGLLYSLGYGGGTANVEFETLTSLSMNNFSYSMTIPYVFLVPKLDFTPTAIQSYSTKNAIHPYTARTYSRSEAFKKFGFQDFYTRWYGTKTVKYDGALGRSEFTSDSSSFKDVLELLQEKKQSQFIQLSTMQNHMPYNQGTYDETYTGLTSDLTKDSEDKLGVYTQGLKYTDEAVKEFIGKVSKMKRHVTVVFFGDHLPGFYEWQNGNSSKISKYENILHQSDYFIYSNFKTKKVSRPVASANMFTPMMLEKTNSKVSPYYAMLTEIAKKTPANELGKYMDNSGKFISDKKLTKTQKEILRDYQLIQYDVTTGKKYLNKTNFYKMPK